MHIGLIWTRKRQDHRHRDRLEMRQDADEETDRETGEE
jgi:hypothetical protein